MWRWRNALATDVQRELEQAQRDPEAARPALDQLKEQLNTKAGDLQALRDQLAALRSSEPLSSNDLERFASKIALSIEADGARSFWSNVALGFVFMVLGLVLQYVVNWVTGQN